MPSAGAHVAGLATTPVKSLRLACVESLRIEAGGVRDDRSLFVVDERGRMVNGKHHGALQQVRGHLEGGRRLVLSLPGGCVVEGPLATGAELEVGFYGRPRRVLEVEGPFAEALSRHVGTRLRLVAPADGSSAVDRGGEGAVTLICSASVQALASLAGLQSLDVRRFRMSIEVGGTEPFAEDAWHRRELSVGGARLRVEGHVGRCLVTSRDPDSGEIDVATLELLRELRGEAQTTEPLALGVHASVLAPGAVAVGDAVAIVDTGGDADRAGGR